MEFTTKTKSTVQKSQIYFGIILLTFLVLLATLLNSLQLLQRWDNLFYDLETTFISRPINKNIVIISIDDASLKKLGKWPWPRAIHARLINQLTAAKVSAIGMDFLFLEPDLIRPKDDWLLAESIRLNEHVVLPALTKTENGHTYLIKPLEEIADAAHLAHANLSFDTQGIVRELDLMLELSNGQYLPSMALSLNQQLPGNNKLAYNISPQKRLLAFSTLPHQFRKISYADVLLDANIRKELQNKVILIGITATGLSRNIATPLSQGNQLMSGVEFQANALASIQSNWLITPLEWHLYLLFTLFLLLMPVILYQFLSPGIAFLLALGFAALIFLTSFFLLSTFQLWFAPLPAILSLIISYPLSSIRKLKQLGISLFQEREHASATLKAIGDSVIRTDKHGRIEFMNPAAEKILACHLEDVRLLPFTEICEIIDPESRHYTSTFTYTPQDKFLGISFIRNRKQQEYAVHISTSPVYAENGLQEGVVHAFSDLTKINAITKKIAYIASHDALTGLLNQLSFKELIEKTILNAIQEDQQFAVLFIDLDGFKKVIDGMGHDNGDQLLKKAAVRLKNCVGGRNVISRWGGDEFTILLNNISFSSDASDLALKIKECLSHSFIINNQEIFTSLSIGISLFPDDGQQADELLLRADMAMYNVKLNGRDNYCFYSKELDFQAKEELVMEVELRHALLRKEFVIHYQPQIDLISNQLTGMEALIRWQHPTKGRISPDAFIPLAEETGLIIPIGQWIIKDICQQIKQWLEQGLSLVKVAVNLSTIQFLQKDLVGVITREIQRYDIPADLLQVEITESTMIHDINQVIKILGGLKSAGISIAIDDFGTGYSSLEYLKRLPIDKLKIDKSFIENIINNPDDASIVQAVISLGHNMNMQIIAEGVETEEQANLLQKQKCDFAQGYFFSRPVPAQEIEEMLKKHSKQTLH